MKKPLQQKQHASDLGQRPLKEIPTSPTSSHCLRSSLSASLSTPQQHLDSGLQCAPDSSRRCHREEEGSRMTGRRLRSFDTLEEKLLYPNTPPHTTQISLNNLDYFATLGDPLSRWGRHCL